MGVLSFYRMGCCENDSKIAISNKILQKQVKKRPTCTSLYSPRVSFSHLSGPSEWAWVKGLFIEMLCILKAHIQSVSHFLHHRKRVGLCNQSNNEFGPLLCITAEADSSVPFNWPRRYYTDITRLPCTDINRDSFLSYICPAKKYQTNYMIVFHLFAWTNICMGKRNWARWRRYIWRKASGPDKRDWRAGLSDWARLRTTLSSHWIYIFLQSSQPAENHFHIA